MYHAIDWLYFIQIIYTWNYIHLLTNNVLVTQWMCRWITCQPIYYRNNCCGWVFDGNTIRHYHRFAIGNEMITNSCNTLHPAFIALNMHYTWHFFYGCVMIADVNDGMILKIKFWNLVNRNVCINMVPEFPKYYQILKLYVGNIINTQTQITHWMRAMIFLILTTIPIDVYFHGYFFQLVGTLKKKYLQL